MNQGSEAVSEKEMMQRDALQEIGTIGAAHASSALSTLTKQDIMVEVSESFICMTQDLPTAFSDTEQTVVAVFLEAYGKGKGSILMVLGTGIALELVDLVFSREPDPCREFTEEDQDAICEIGNICASAYLNAISSFIGVTMVPSPPGIAIDMLSAILQFPAQLVEQVSDNSVVIKTQFVLGKESFFGFILYMPDADSQQALMEKFNIV